MTAHHGNTPAAWAGAAVTMVGFVIGGIALMVHPAAMVMFWIGVVFAVAGLPVFLVMAKMGLNDAKHG
jgi:hypothetical protein